MGGAHNGHWRANPHALVTIRASAGLSMVGKFYEDGKICSLEPLSLCCGRSYVLQDVLHYGCGQCGKILANSSLYRPAIRPHLVQELHHGMRSWLDLTKLGEGQKALLTLLLEERISQWVQVVSKKKIIRQDFIRHVIEPQAAPRLSRHFLRACAQASGEL